MRPILKFALLALFLVSITACGSSEEAVATAIAKTAEGQAMQALVQTATAAALATDTPIPSATSTLTPTVTDTPAPTAVPVPPAGMAYVPDFIGMELSEAEEFLEDNDFRYIYVALINRDVPQWTIYEQEPAPGTLINLHDDRIRIVVAVYEFTPTPRPEPRAGSSSGNACGDVTYVGYCDGVYCIWCEDNQLWYIDCYSACGGTCGWDPVGGIYNCFCP